MKNTFIKRKIISILILPWSRIIPTRFYLQILFYLMVGYRLDLINPITYNQKIQALKILDNNPLNYIVVDKHEVRKYIVEKGLSHILINSYGVWNKFSDIEFSNLPESFVLKTTHDSGGVVIVHNINTIDKLKMKNQIEKSLRKNYYYVWREMPYKYVRKRIIAEQYLVDESQEELKDYKFFCFNGNPYIFYIASERQSGKETKFDFFDLNFKHLDIINGHPNSTKTFVKPDNFDLMVEYAKILSRDFIHVRVDLYNVNGKIYFGELTLYHWSGLVPFYPLEWDYELGKLINLDEVIKI